MKTEHFPSLELCKKLTEIGFPKTENYIAEVCHEDGTKVTIIDDDEIRCDFLDVSDSYVCPSVMEMLDEIKSSKVNIEFELSVDGYYSVFASKPYILPETKRIRGTLPNSLAEMIIWLHENNYISFNN